MHGGERRLGRRLPLSGGGVQKLGDVEIGLIDPIRARSRKSRRGAENERHSRRGGRLSNDHSLPPLDRTRHGPRAAKASPWLHNAINAVIVQFRRSNRMTIVREARCSWAPAQTRAGRQPRENLTSKPKPALS